jgi:bacteriocin-like protein
MSTDKKQPTEVPPKGAKTELTEEELAKVSGGETLVSTIQKKDSDTKNSVIGKI